MLCFYVSIHFDNVMFIKHLGTGTTFAMVGTVDITTFD